MASLVARLAASFPALLLRPRLVPCVRALSTLEHPPKPDTRSGKNLFELAALMPTRGVGTRFVRKSWTRNGYEDTHWTVKRIKFEPVRAHASPHTSHAQPAHARGAAHQTFPPNSALCPGHVGARAAPPRSQDGRHGDVWGTLTWRGQEKKAMGRVRGALKREWRYEPVSDVNVAP
jgi:hypothetical protein